MLSYDERIDEIKKQIDSIVDPIIEKVVKDKSLGRNQRE